MAGWLCGGGCALGAWRRWCGAHGASRRARRTRVLRARLKSEESLSAEREQALARAREQLQAVFGELARDSLQEQQRSVPDAGA
jgi:DNA anti-recombination protein RmuC